MRYLGMNDLREINRMTLAEYNLRIKAYRLRKLDRDREIAFSAWLNREINATRKRGKKIEYIYRDFNKFFDYEKREREILDGSNDKGPEDSVTSRLKEYMREKQCQDIT